tara:strand:+ start:1191 stop:3266 length:2076 start_codon:yes stop_codon:yes gene_type:complete
MKLHTNVNTVERSGQFEESNFSIEASAKAFFILSDGLYSNKIKAVIRELSTNAYDSHVDAGCPETPFEVHLPTQMEPHFHVRDFGVGLSHEDCMKLYTTYFYSNKTDRNDSVGCLGLGSKSPFAYVDSFTVESYYEGTYRVYTAYKNEDSNPVFALLSEAATDEPNGLKVTVSVEKDDFYDFQWEATELYKFFDTKPEFLGKEINFHEDEMLLEGDYWKFVSNGHDNYIIMGQIAYPIDEDQFNYEDKAGNFLCRASGLRLYCDIGKVDITPSRESLSYNNATKETIEGLVNDISEEIGEKIQSEIESQPTLFAARNKFLSLLDSCRALKVAVEHLDSGIEWGGKELFENKMGYYVESDMNIRIYSKDNWRETVSLDTSKRVHFGNRFSYIFDDLKRGGVGRTRQWLKDQGGSQTAHFFKNADFTVDKVCEILSCEPSDLTMTSSLERVESYRTSSGGGGGAKAAFYEDGKWSDCSVSVKQEDAYYILESRSRLTEFYNRRVESLSRDMKRLENMGHDFSDYNIFLVKPSAAKTMKLDGRKNWTSFMPIFQQKVREELAEHKEDIKLVKNQSSLCKWDDDTIKDICKETKTGNELEKLFNTYKKDQERVDSVRNKVRVVRDLQELWDVNYSYGEDNTVNFEHQFEDLMNRYPMFKVLDDNSSSWIRSLDEEEIKAVAAYIDLIEMKEGANV